MEEKGKVRYHLHTTFIFPTGRGGREKVGKIGLEGQMEELVRQAEEARVGVLQALGSRYVELTSAISDTALLQQRVSSTLQNVTDLHTSIDQDVSHVIKVHITSSCHLRVCGGILFDFFSS